MEESDVGILGSILGKREPAVEFRTVDGGHPAPFPDMTDEQLYNYEVAFNVARRTFDKPPVSARTAKAPPAAPRTQTAAREAGRQQQGSEQRERHQGNGDEEDKDDNDDNDDKEDTHTHERHAERTVTLPLLDLGKPVRLITTKQPVDIITTRARHPVYKVHAYIGSDEVVTLFTLDGQLSENGPRFLENVPQRQQLYLNIYPNADAHDGDRYVITQHGSRQEADTSARTGRIVCVSVQFDL